MPSIAIDNGKRIEELLEVTKISDDSYFLVSESDLTRKITLTYLRNAFNGDTATEGLNNLYYSVEKINELLGHVWDDIDKINTKLDNFEDRINNIYNDLGGDLSDFKNYVAQIYAELKLADQNLNTKIDNVNESLTNEINRVENDFLEFKEETEGNISSLDTRLKVVENKLANITRIEVGTEVPDTLESGVIYLQYFIPEDEEG